MSEAGSEKKLKIPPHKCGVGSAETERGGKNLQLSNETPLSCLSIFFFGIYFDLFFYLPVLPCTYSENAGGEEGLDVVA